MTTAKTKPAVQPATEMTLLRRHAIAAAVSAAFAVPAYAQTVLPQGFTPTSGQTATNYSGNTLSIVQSSSRASGDWTSFNTSSNASVIITQTLGSGTALYRVSSPVEFYGRLSAPTTQLFLQSMQGVYFAPGASVDVGSLVATNLNILQSDFDNGRYVFTNSGASGSVTNRGTITAAPNGYVALLGPKVTNGAEGIITARLGSVALAAGDKITLDMVGDGLVKVTVDQAALNAAVLNKGAINADGGNVFLTAKSANALLDTVINTEGVIRANSISERNGTIVLDGGDKGVVSVSGTIEAKGNDAGTTGGTVKVLGEYVGLGLNGAATTVTASGDAGGGTVLVGGNYQGQGPEANATGVYMGPTASINVDAVNNGNGGKAILWSNDTTRFFGSISARGGAQGGNGGLVETSSHNYLLALGTVNASAPNGLGGLWLLDPNDITISGGTQTNIDNTVATVFDTTDDSAVVNNATLGAALANGTSVTVNTQSAVTNAQNGDITVAASVTAAATTTATLSLNASRNISFTAAGSLNAGTGTLNVNLNAGNGPVLGTPGTAASTVIMASGSSITTGGGNVSVTSKGAVTLAGVDTTGGGTLTVNSNGGAITQASAITVAGTSSFTAGANVITLTSANNDFQGAVTLSNSGANNVQITDKTGGISLAASTVGQDLTVLSTGAVTQTGALTVPGNASFTAGGNAITITTAANSFGGDVSLSNSGNLASITDSTALSLGASSVGSLAAISGGPLTQTGALTTSTTASFSAGANAITITTAANSFGGAVSLSNSGANVAAITDSTALSLGASSVGQLAAISGGAITQTGAVTATGVASFSAGANAITMTTAGNDFQGAVTLTGTAVQITDTNALSLAGSSMSTLVAIAGGDITQTGALTTTGTASFTAGANAITITTAGNSFGGDVTLSNSGANLAAITDSTPLSFAASSVGQLAAISNGAITQTGAVTATGVASFTAGANAITLTNTNNDFQGAVTLSNSGANNVQITDKTGITLAASTVGQDLTVIASGSILQTGALTVPGAASFTAGANAITITTAGNSFGGDVSLSNSGANVAAITDSTALSLGTSSVGQLDAISAGDITQTGAVTATGVASFTAGANAITLTNTNNDFQGAVTLSNSGANAVQITDKTGITLAASTVGQDLTVIATGTILQTGALTVPGAASFTAGGNAITITTAANSFGGDVSLSNSGNLASITDSTALSLGASSVGSLAAISGGPLTQTGALTTSTTASFSAGANAITITTAANSFGGAVSLSNSGANVAAITDSTALSLGASSVGQLAAISGGAITQTGAVTATGVASFSAGANAITMTTAGNDFQGAVTLTGTAVQITDTNALSLAGSSMSTLVAIAGGDITQTGALTTTGTASFTAGANAITITTAGNSFGGDVTLSNSGANLAAITDSTPLSFAASSVGQLAAISNGAITQTGAVTATGVASFTAGANAITLTNTNNDFQGAVTLSNSGANNVQITDKTGITLAASTVGQDLTVIASGSILQTGALTVPGTASFNAGANAITLTTATNNFGGAVDLTGTTVSITDNTPLDLGAGSYTTLAAVSNGALTQSGALTTTGTASFTAGANAITITTAANSFGGDVTLSNSGANLAAITDNTPLSLAASSVGQLAAISNGAITQTGAITATGNASFNAGANAITLTTATNSFGAAIALTGTNVAITDNTPLDLGAGSYTTLAAVSNGALTQSGALTTTGTASFTAGANAITITTAGNSFGGDVTLSNSGANLAAITDNTPLSLAASSVGQLAAISNGAITQTGAVTATGVASFSAGANAITMTTAGNDFQGAVTLTGTAVQITDTNALSLAGSSMSTLVAIAGGDITQTGALTTTGTASFTAGANAITITTAGNSFGGDVTLSNSGANLAAITDSTPLSFAASSVGQLAAISNGAITQTGAVTATGVASFTAGANAITLTNTNNDFQGAVTLSNSGANNVQITDKTGITLAASTVGQDLTVIASGSILQTGALTVPGTASFNAGANAITLTTATNNFGGAVDLTGTTVSITDNTPLDLGAGSYTTLAAVSNGALTQSGALTTTGTASFTAGANAITITTAANSFGGDVTLSNSGANLAAITDNTPLSLAASSVGQLAAISNGAITQTGAITATGNASFNAGANAITLTTATNSFGAAIALTGTNVAITDNTPLDLGAGSYTTLAAVSNGALTQSGALTTTGTASFTAGANAITITTAGNSFGGDVTLSNSGANLAAITDNTPLSLAASSVGQLAAISNGAITQTGAVTATGVASFSAGANAITMTTAGNDFQGAVTLTGTAVQITDTNALSLAGSSMSTLVAIAGGDITQTGALTTTGTASFTAGANAITITTAGNSFGGDVTLSNSGANLAAITDSTPLSFAASSVGQLAAISNGAITQTGAVTATGVASFTAGANAITLTNTNNDFQGAVTLSNSGANNVQITDKTGITLAASTVGQDLTVIASGSILQTGALTVPGTASFNAGANAITLTTATNNFGGAVDLTGTTVSITDNTPLDLGAGSYTTLAAVSNGALTQSGALTTTGTASFTAGANAITITTAANSFGGDVTLSNSGANLAAITDNTPLSLAASSVGQLAAISNGAITQTGAITATGNASFNAGANAITLTTAGNDFQGAVTLTGTAVQITDTNALSLAGSSMSTLVAIAGGDITQTGALTTTGTASFTAGANAITITTAGNSFGGDVTLSNSGANLAAITDNTPLSLAASSVGQLAAISNGAITQTGAVTATGVASFSAGANAITMTTAGNDFQGAVTLTGTAVQITDTNALSLAGSSMSTLVAIAGGDITQTGALTTTGTASFTAGANAITITTAGNSFGGDVTLSNSGANLAAITDSTPLSFAASSVGQLAAISNGAITQTGAVTATGVASFTAGANAITITTAANSFGGDVTLSNSGANLAAITDNTPLSLAASSVGQLAAISNGAITQTGAITATGNASFNAGANAITLTTATNSFGGAVDLTGTTVSITDNTPLDLGAGSFTTLAAVSNGALTQSGALTTTGTASFTAGANAITITTAGNSFGGDVTLSNSGANLAAITDNTPLSLAASSVGQLAAISNGAITQTGAITATGVASFSAGANAITLTTAGNDFQGAVTLTGTAVQITDTNALSLAGSSMSTLVAIAGGDITQTGALTTTGTASFTAGANAITITTAGNSFGGDVTLSNSGANLAAITDSTALSLAGSTVGSLAAISGGALTQTGALTTATTASFTAGANAITITTAGNSFGGAVSLSNSGNLASITDSTALDLGASSVGSLAAISGGTLTQSGAVTTATTASFTAGANAITMTTAGNSFGGDVTLSNSGNLASITDSTALSLGASTVGSLAAVSGGALTQTGALTTATTASFTAGANAITITTAGNSFGGDVLLSNSGNLASITDNTALSLGASSVGSLAAISNGAITQSAAVTTGTTASFNAGANAITMTTAGNSFGGTVTLAGTTVQITDNTPLDLGAGSFTTLAAISNGALTQSGALTTTGTASFTAGANAITITTAANSFGGDVSLSNSGANTASITDNTPLSFGASSVGSLVALSNGAITQSGAITATGTSSFTAGGNAITLNSANDFTGAVTLINSGAASPVQITDSNAITFAPTLSLGGDFTVNAGGLITTSGVSNVGNQQYNSSLSMNGIYTTGGGNFAVTGATTLAGTTTVNATAGTATFTTVDGAQALTVNSLANETFGVVGGTTALTSIATDAPGTVTLNGNVRTTGSQTFLDAVTAGTITLTSAGGTIAATNAANNFTGTLTLANPGGTATIVDGTGGLTLGTVTAGTLNATSTGGAISAGNTTVTGVSTINAGTNSITMTGANDFQGAVNLTGSSANVSDGTGGLTLGTLALTGPLTATSTGAGTLNLGTGTIAGALVANSAGAITESGAITGITTAGLTAGGGGAITLTSANDFTGMVTFNTTGPVSITDINALALTAAANPSSLTTVSNGTTSIGNLTTAGALSMNAGAGTLTTGNLNVGSLNLSNGAFAMTTGTITSAGTTTATSGGPLTVGNTTSGGALNFTAGGLLTFGTITGSVNPLNSTSLTGGALQGVGGGITGSFGTLTSGANVLLANNVLTNYTGAMQVAGATTWNLAAGSTASPFLVANNTINLSVNGLVIAASVGSAQANQALASAQSGPAAEAAKEAGNTFGTDSVAEQIQYGFAGDVGVLPPINHRLTGVGISVPKCFNESREGEGC